MTRRTNAQYVQELAVIGKLEAMEEYAGVKISILHRCLVHGEEGKARPDHALKGGGLKCCGSNELLKENKAAKYAGRVSEIGRVEPLEAYIDSQTKILHKCLIHGEIHKACPNEILKGRGLYCCKGVGKRGVWRYTDAEYAALCAEHGRVEPLESWKGGENPILHRCLTHGEEHMTSPRHIIRGKGLKCCRLGGDNITRLQNDEAWANSPCHVYLARVNGAYTKPGITNDLPKRMKDSKGYYKSYAFESPVLTRAEAWAIEQRLLKESMDARPETLPEIYSDWGGRSELRLKDTLPESWYISRFWELMDELNEEGWKSVAMAV